MDFEESRLPSLMWWASSKQLKDWIEQETELLKGREKSASRWPQDLDCNIRFPLGICPLATLQIWGWQPLELHEPFFIENLPHHSHTACWFCFSGEPRLVVGQTRGKREM